MTARTILAVLGSTATGKSALGIALAERFGGEIVNCDSTAIYRGFDIGTDKVPAAERRGIAHHLIDVAGPTETYTAADYGRDASAIAGAIVDRGLLPIVVGGTGFYYRALTRGIFPGPGRDPGLRKRLERIAERHGVQYLHRMVGRVDPASALRIQPRDRMRLIRALEVYFVSGRPLTAHFVETQSPLDGWQVIPVALRVPQDLLVARIARRVDRQFARGLMAEIEALLARGVPETAHPFGGLVYRQALELRRGLRSEAETRELIVRENRRYARRQLIWFRKEPNLEWFEGPGESDSVIEAVARHVGGALARVGVPPSQERGGA